LRRAAAAPAAARPNAGALRRAASAWRLYAATRRARLRPAAALGSRAFHAQRAPGPRPLRLEPPL